MIEKSMTREKYSITRQDLFQSPLSFMAFGFGSGLLPKAPGTAGTLAAIPLVWALAQSTVLVYATVTLICILVGPAICAAGSKTLAARGYPCHDHPGIVWDEIAGMMLTLVFIPFSGTTLIAGFILFRLFDIVKPWPIGYLDRRVQGGLGIMLDDIIAALLANIILRILLQYSVL